VGFIREEADSAVGPSGAIDKQSAGDLHIWRRKEVFAAAGAEAGRLVRAGVCGNEARGKVDKRPAIRIPAGTSVVQAQPHEDPAIAAAFRESEPFYRGQKNRQRPTPRDKILTSWTA